MKNHGDYVVVKANDLKKGDRFNLAGEECVVDELDRTTTTSYHIRIDAITKADHRLVMIYRRDADYMEVIRADK